ncbi:MAG: glutathione S-transferase, partial [Pseudolabrys sp.]
MSDLTLYHASPSRSSVALWMLEEVGQPYDIKLLRLSAGDNMKPDYLAINPMGKVPALKHGDVVITESAAICAYLADAFPQAGLAPPPTSKERAPYYRWMFFAAGPFEAATSNKALGFVVPPER